jgi:hypothetical protein
MAAGCRRGSWPRANAIVCALVAAMLLLALIPAVTTTASATSFTYDERSIARIDTREVYVVEAASPLVNDPPEVSASPSIEARGTSTTSSRSFVATNTADDLVRFDPEWASRQIAGQNLPGSTGYATTPGGNTLSVHAAERTFLGGPGRAPIEPSLIDDILSQGTRVTYRGINDTVKVSAPNLCGKCYVVVDAQTGTHVVTVMVPK